MPAVPLLAVPSEGGTSTSSEGSATTTKSSTTSYFPKYLGKIRRKNRHVGRNKPSSVDPQGVDPGPPLDFSRSANHQAVDHGDGRLRLKQRGLQADLHPEDLRQRSDHHWRGECIPLASGVGLLEQQPHRAQEDGVRPAERVDGLERLQRERAKDPVLRWYCLEIIMILILLHTYTDHLLSVRNISISTGHIDADRPTSPMASPSRTPTRSHTAQPKSSSASPPSSTTQSPAPLPPSLPWRSARRSQPQLDWQATSSKVRPSQCLTSKTSAWFGPSESSPGL